MASAHQAAFQVCREADGFQRSLVSPEAGLRRLVHDSVETVLIPVDNTVRRVHQVLMEASRCDSLPSSSPSACVTTILGVCFGLDCPRRMYSIVHKWLCVYQQGTELCGEYDSPQNSPLCSAQ